MAIIECQKLTKQYGGVTALNAIDLKLESGRIVGLLGPNGSGKTTLIKILNGLLQPSSGSVSIDGAAPSPSTKALVSYLPERISLPLWMKVTQLLEYYDDFFDDFDRAAAEQMLEHLDIDEKMTVKQMSKGTREKVQLILVMSRKAMVYLLDEPIGGVDPATRDYIISTIITNYNENAVVIISTHLISDVENILDEVVFIKNGCITEHTSVDTIRTEHGKSVDEYFREVFKC